MVSSTNRYWLDVSARDPRARSGCLLRPRESVLVGAFFRVTRTVRFTYGISILN